MGDRRARSALALLPFLACDCERERGEVKWRNEREGYNGEDINVNQKREVVL